MPFRPWRDWLSPVWCCQSNSDIHSEITLCTPCPRPRMEGKWVRIDVMVEYQQQTVSLDCRDVVLHDSIKSRWGIRFCLATFRKSRAWWQRTECAFVTWLPRWRISSALREISGAIRANESKFNSPKPRSPSQSRYTSSHPFRKVLELRHNFRSNLHLWKSSLWSLPHWGSIAVQIYSENSISASRWGKKSREKGK